MIILFLFFHKKKTKSREEISRTNIKVKSLSQLFFYEKEFQCISTIAENVLQLQSPCPLSVHQSSKIAAITSFFQFPV